ncbi:MAG: peptidoglycan editing factor PgeF [Clostridiaceae bacterium]|nr:peptidoglycan editing factor PgeF [Clostridiaceae bacterium]
MTRSGAPMWIEIPLGDDIKAKAFFTTRHGGVSSFPYDSLNLSFQRDDSRENVMRNFELLSESIRIPMECMVLTCQVHGSDITLVGSEHCGMGLLRDRTFGESDGLITSDRNVALVTFHADCAPVYLYDGSKKVIGLIHSGWRSTLRKISGKAVKIMKEQFNCNSRDINAIIGPCIRKCCFEVGYEVYREFLKVFPECTGAFSAGGDKWKIDLTGIIKHTLAEEGVSRENIHDVNRCTVCEKELFFSHRGGRGKSGTGAAVFMMTE